MLNILTYPNEKLKQKSADVTSSEMKNWKLQTFIDEMIETMKGANGIGLAAPQVGQNIRIIIATDENGKIFALINPVIVKSSLFKTKSEEGCLSVPGKIGIVKRHKTVEAEAIDRIGKKVKIKAKGIFAIVLQHEIDHLDGILFIDRAEKIMSVTNYK